MSDRATRSNNDGDGSSVHPSRSAWMAHWKRSKALSANYESMEDKNGTKKHPLFGGPELATDISLHGKGSRQVVEGKSHFIKDESLVDSSKKIKNERLDSQPFPVFNLSQNTEITSCLKNEQVNIGHGEVLKTQIDHSSGCNTVSLHKRYSCLPSMLALFPERESPSRLLNYKPKGIRRYPENSLNNFLNNNLAVSTFVQDEYMGSASKLFPFEPTTDGSPSHSSVFGKSNNNQADSILSSKGHATNINFQGCSTFMVDNHLLDSRRSLESLSKQKNRTLLLHDQLADSARIEDDTRQNQSGIGLLQSQSSHPDATVLKKLYGGSYSLPRQPYSLHDVETMKICTTVDSVEESCRGAQFSQSTQRLLITKKTGINLSEGCQMIRESTVATELKGKAFSELFDISTEFDLHDQRAAKLSQPLGCSTDGEGKEKGREIGTSALRSSNESSAETDVMDMDAFLANHLSGVASFPSNKDLERSRKPISNASASMREQIGDGLINTELPDINQELPAPGSLMNDREASTSRTQSLDVGHLLCNADRNKDSKSTALPGSSFGPELSSRWVKRLKRSAPYLAHDVTKISKKVEACSSENVIQLNQTIKPSIANSEPTMTENRCKELIGFDQTATTMRKKDSSNRELKRKSREMLLSHPWIRRWCQNGAATSQTKPETAVVFDPQYSKLTVDEIEKKQFPSIAAMALMGKAMAGFRSCEFSKRGSFLVWNTESF